MDRDAFVDYQRVAGTYARGRELTETQLSRWLAVVASRLPDGTLRLVVDGGAGSGAFLPMWERLGAECIVAVEPAAAMRKLAESRADSRTVVTDGNLAAIAVHSQTVDVVWISTVLHHVADREAAFAELARVLRPGGRLLIRGFVPGASRVPWLDHFPGAERAAARFPNMDAIRSLGRSSGFRVVDAVVVEDTDRSSARDVATWVSRMREADSLLTALTSKEIEAGLENLRAMAERLLEPVSLSLVVLERR